MPARHLIAIILFPILFALPAGADDYPWERTGVNDALARVITLLERREARWPAPPPPPASGDPRLLSALRGQLSDPDPQSRAAALEGMGSATDAAHAVQLLSALNDPDPSVRGAALGPLQATAPALLADALTGAAFPLDPAWAAAFAPLASPELGRRLIAGLEDPAMPPDRRAAAARALALIRRADAAPTLAAQVREGRQPLAQAALDALFFLRAGEAIPHWLQLLDHRDPQVALTAVRALADLGGPAANAAVARIATRQAEATGPMQSAALRGIDTWPAAEAIPALVAVMESNPDLRTPALRILRDRTGLELGPDPALWRAWMAGELEPGGQDLPPDATRQPVGDPSQDALPFSVQFVPE